MGQILQRASVDLTWSSSVAGNVVDASPALLDFLRVPLERIRDFTWTQVVHPADQARVVAQWMHSMETGEPFDQTYRLNCGGEYVEVHGRAELVGGRWEGSVERVPAVAYGEPQEGDKLCLQRPPDPNKLRSLIDVQTYRYSDTEAPIGGVATGGRAVNPPHFARKGGVMLERIFVVELPVDKEIAEERMDEYEARRYSKSYRRMLGPGTARVVRETDHPTPRRSNSRAT